MNEEMDFEKRSSKRNFLQLFDWNGKSRKKLFSNKTESSATEKSKQGEENLNGSTFSRLKQVDRNGYDPGPNMIDNYNLNCSYAKAPGVVARLMGLDSLPTSDIVEPSCTPESFRDTRYTTGFPGFQIEGNTAMYDGMRNKLDGFSKNPVEVMLHKVQNRPIEKFQTEVLPPKSAKPISITHHRLLSPIKSPGFIRTMEADYLIEAASKIIEQSPRSMMTHKLPSLGSPSVPLRIQDIKEKVEAAEKSRRKFRTSQKRKEERFMQYEGREEGLDLLRVSGKPEAAKYEDSRKKLGSFSFQAKQKIPKRDELGSVDIQSSVNQGQSREVKRSFVGRSVERKHKNVEMKSQIIKQSDVFRQNSHRQNGETKEGSDSFRCPIPNEKEKKSSSSSGFSRPSKTVNPRVAVSTDSLSTMKESQASDYRKGHAHASSISRKCSRKKRDSDEGNVATLVIDERSDNCKYETHKSNLWESAVGKNGMDVVSFTFNSPIKKPISESISSGKSPESKRSPFDFQSDSTQGLDVASGDSLSILLEQKLKELAFRVETSQKDLIYSELLCGSADSSQGSASAVDMMTSSKSAKRLDLSGTSFRFECSSPLDESWNYSMPRWKGSNEACNGTVPSNSVGSCLSRDPNGCISNKGIERCLTVEALDIAGWSSSRNSNGVDNELLDSAASSTSLTTFTCSTIRESSNWELEYIKFILSNACLMLEKFVLEKTQTLVPSGLFDIMENGNLWWNQNVGDYPKLSRKALFDCVGESLHLKCLPFINKGRKHLMKLTLLFGQLDHLSKELYKEISGWKNMEDLLVDELVDKDMSTQLGGWVDFEIEVFEQGAEIEGEILASLFDELVYDFFL